MLNIVLFGPPGSGKGTQSVKVAEHFHLAHISTGDIFRAEIRNQTDLGKRVEAIIQRGELVPDDLLVEILEKALNSHPGKDGFIFDGFPRTLRQAHDLDDLLSRRGESVSMVIALEVNEEELVKRLLNRAKIEGRLDDTEEVILNRMKVYHQQTLPLIEYYQKQGKYHPVKGIGSIEEIFHSICDTIMINLS